jgi:hypothetical protein
MDSTNENYFIKRAKLPFVLIVGVLLSHVLEMTPEPGMEKGILSWKTIAF